MRIPDTHYARSGDLRIAYQQWGSGPNLIIVPALISNIEVTWEHELVSRVLEHLGKYFTCVQFDKRGIGLSDRFDQMPTLSERLGDINAVMNAVHWTRAHFLGVSEGGAMAQLFAADHPEQVESLVLVNSVISPRYRQRVSEHVEDGDPPLRKTKEIYEKFLHLVETWSEEPSHMVDWMMPSQSGNESFIRWNGRLQRLTCSPRDFRRQVESVHTLDAGDAPERIKARTLVMHTKGDRVLPVAGSRLLAKLIPGARYYEDPGDDHFSWIMPSWRDGTDTIIEFISGTTVEPTSTRRFGAVLFTDIVDSTKQSSALGDHKWSTLLEGHDRVARKLIAQHGGRLIKSTGDGLLAIFDAPFQGVACGIELKDAIGGIGVTIRAGLHVGQIEVHESGDISGIAVNLAARVEQQAGGGEFWTSSTVRDMMLGGAETFIDRGEYEFKGIDGRWKLYSVG
jgi:pimeloyl-ACP methyl ester carboxylesterase